MAMWWTVAVLCLCLTGYGHAQKIANGVLKCDAWSVVCNNGYVYTENELSFKAGDEVCGECQRSVWSGEEANALLGLELPLGFPMPRAPRAGWAVCVTAVPTRYTRASVDFMADEGRTFISHFDIRMAGKPYDDSFGDTIVINEAETDDSGSYDWASQDTYHPYPYPFSVGDEFIVKIEATSENSLTYYVNGKEEATRNLQNSIHRVDRVVVQGDVSISQINLWCE